MVRCLKGVLPSIGPVIRTAAAVLSRVEVQCNVGGIKGILSIQSLNE